MLTHADQMIFLRAALAAFLGLIVGWERQAVGSPVRARIIALVALTAAILTALGSEMFGEQVSRVVQGIITGIGFLGAGMIFRSPTGEVRGLTTAAGLWAMSAIGVAVGSGREVLGVMLTVLTYAFIAWDEWPILSRLTRQKIQQPPAPDQNQPPVKPRPVP